MEQMHSVCRSEKASGTIRISITPVVLAYFAERKKGTREDVTKTVFTVARRLEGTPVTINAVFRGDIESQGGDVWSETVDEELWYWLSNQFLQESSSTDNLILYFEENKPLNGYRLDRIGENLKEICWPSEDARQMFLKVLREVISLAP